MNIDKFLELSKDKLWDTFTEAQDITYNEGHWGSKR